MIQEMMQAVKEAESKAEQIVKDAAKEAEDTIEKAKAQARALKEEKVERAKEQAASDLKNLQAVSEQEMAGLTEDSKKDIAALKELAAAKEAQAIDLVISKLY